MNVKISEKEFISMVEAGGYETLIVEGVDTGTFRLVAIVDGKKIYFRDLKKQIKT